MPNKLKLIYRYNLHDTFFIIEIVINYFNLSKTKLLKNGLFMINKFKIIIHETTLTFTFTFRFY